MKNTLWASIKVQILMLLTYASLSAQSNLENADRYIKSGEYEKARQFLSQEFISLSQDPMVYYLYAMTYYRIPDKTGDMIYLNTDYENLNKYLKEAIAKDPTHGPSRLLLASQQISNIKFSDAKRHLNYIEDVNIKRSWEYSRLLAIIEKSIGQHPRNNQAALEILLSASPDSVNDYLEYYRILYDIYMDLEEYNKALATVSGALKILPDDRRMLKDRAIAKVATKNYYGAADDFIAAYKLYLEETENVNEIDHRYLYDIKLHIGRSLGFSRKYEEAIKYLSESLDHLQVLDAEYDVSYWQYEIDEGLKEAYIYLGDCYHRLENRSEACSNWNQANNLGVSLGETRQNFCNEDD